MLIHVVQPDENIESIASYYGVSVTSIIQNNGLINPYSLVPGQTIVIVYPNQTHTVAEGDTIAGIANQYGVSILQLLRNNPFLSDRSFIYPGETIVISYETGRRITTNGIAYPYIPLDVLRKTLPFLTYLSIYNYRVTEEGRIVSYYDDSELVNLAKTYGTVPLMLVTTTTIQGEPNPQIALDILTNEEIQDSYINDLLEILRRKEFYGVNLFYNYMNSTNKNLYDTFTAKISDILSREGYFLLITINPNINFEGTSIYRDVVNYSLVSQPVNAITFLNLIWEINDGPPLPVISIPVIEQFITDTISDVTNGLINMGIPIIGYDWALPYIEGITRANSLTINTAITIANDEGVDIQFDESSQTPYFYYNQYPADTPVEHIVRFIDARTINGATDLITKYGLSGIAVWNIMIFYDQLWLIINSQFQIEKLIPDSLNT